MGLETKLVNRFSLSNIDFLPEKEFRKGQTFYRVNNSHQLF